MRYRDLVAKYQEVNPLAKEYNITDYLSLAKYYDLQSSEIPSSNS
ncbi:hypothetical protein [Helicobacter muridarum]|nr:hypothetical protein [Helicobacter muridarum]